MSSGIWNGASSGTCFVPHIHQTVHYDLHCCHSRFIHPVSVINTLPHPPGRKPASRTGVKRSMSNIRLKQVTKVYPNGLKALDQFDLEIASGEWVSVMGP